MEKMIDTKKNRIWEIELLRVVTMYMIVLFHVLNHGGVRDAVFIGGQYEIVWFLEALLCCSVNVYAIISGYVGYTSSETKKSVNKFFNLWLQVFFYSLLLDLLISFMQGSYSIKEIVKACFPITTTQYWYFTAYVGVYFVAPWINKLLKSMEYKEAKKAFIGFCGVFLLYVSITGIFYDPFKVEGGYSFLWLTILYILGAFLRKLEIPKLVEKRKAVVGLVSCWGISFFVKKMVPTQNIFINYTSITTIGISIAFIIIFAKINNCKNLLIEKLVRVFGPATFGVYLVHDHSMVRSYFIEGKLKWIIKLSPWKFVIVLCSIGLFIFIVALSIELIRVKLFSKIKALI